MTPALPRHRRISRQFHGRRVERKTVSKIPKDVTSNKFDDVARSETRTEDDHHLVELPRARLLCSLPMARARSECHAGCESIVVNSRERFPRERERERARRCLSILALFSALSACKARFAARRSIGRGRRGKSRLQRNKIQMPFLLEAEEKGRLKSLDRVDSPLLLLVFAGCCRSWPFSAFFLFAFALRRSGARLLGQHSCLCCSQLNAALDRLCCHCLDGSVDCLDRCYTPSNVLPRLFVA